MLTKLTQIKNACCHMRGEIGQNWDEHHPCWNYANFGHYANQELLTVTADHWHIPIQEALVGPILVRGGKTKLAFGFYACCWTESDRMVSLLGFLRVGPTAGRDASAPLFQMESDHQACIRCLGAQTSTHWLCPPRTRMSTRCSPRRGL